MRIRWILLLVVISFATAGEDGLPDTEAGLLEYANKNSNRRNWPKAERAYRVLLEKFPKSAHRAEVHYRLGRLHLRRSRRLSTAAEWYDSLIAQYPASRWSWHGRADRAEIYAAVRKIDAAVAMLRKVAAEAPEAPLRLRASRRVLSVQNKAFALSVRQSFTVGQTPRIQVQARNVTAASFRMERAPYDEIVEHLKPDRLDLTSAAMKAGGRVLVKGWTSEFSQPKDRWQSHNIDLPAVEPGVYLVVASTEGLKFRITVLVNNFGLVAKSAANGLLVFGQDRRQGTPETGLRVRLVTKQGTTERTTNDQGLGRFDALTQNALLIGVKDKEYCFCSVRAWGGLGPQSRVYVTTDRPLYRPGHKVNFKVLHRVDEDGKLAVHAGLNLRVNVTDPKNQVVHAETVSLNRFGTAHGSFELTEEPPLGRYQIRIEPVDAMPGQWEQWSNRGQFRVDEYRKPEYRVEVAFDKGHSVQGDTLKAVVSARYFFGSPVAGAKVRYSIRRSPHWSWWGPKEPWLEWYGGVSRRHYGGGEEVKSARAQLDADGKLAVSFDVPRAERDQRYTIVATVTDLARRQEQGSSSIVAYRAGVAVQVKTERYVYLPGQEVVAKVEVRDHEGAPVPKHAVTVHALRRVWSSTKEEYREVRIGQEIVTTGDDGKAQATLRIDDAGSIILRAETADARGRKTDDNRWVWVTSRNWDGGTMNWRGLSIVADKPSYKPGETATFLLTSEVKDLHLLFTLECRRIYHHAVVKMNGHTATIQVKLDDPGLLPNFFATVAGLHANKSYQRQINVVVDPTDRFLSVEVKPDRAQYKPRDKARFEIVTRDASGKPVAAEVELAGVDEAIYSLQSEYAQDIRGFFLRRRWNRVQTNSSVQYWDWGRPEVVEESEDEDGGSDAGPPKAEAKGKARGMLGGSMSSLVEPVVRRKFADTLLWRPSITTDEHGRAVVTLDQLADNLTTWRLTARGMGLSGRMGQTRNSILVRKEVIARLQVPRFFTQGDHPTLTAIVRNDLGSAKEVRVILEAEGLVVEGESVVHRTIGPKREQRIEWRARVERPGTAKFVLKAMTDTESDALEKKVPILPHGSIQWESSSGILEAEATKAVTLAPDAMPEASQLTIDVTPTHAATVLDALDYLADYPYGCVEQTMSRFLPSTITRQVLRRLEIKKPWLEEHLPKMIRAGLSRLASFQHPDGGWGWWKNDQSNPFTTAYVVYGLAMAREADVVVDARMLARGVAAVRTMIGKVKEDEERIYLLFALSTAGQKVPDVRNALADGAGKLPAVAQAMLALVLHRDGEAKEAARVLGLLTNSAQVSGATAFWLGQRKYRWTGHQVEATAFALDAFLAIAPNHAIVPKVAAWLALNRDAGRWVSTRQTAMVVMAMSKYLQRTGTAAPRMTLSLELNGKQLWQREVTPDNWAAFEGTTVIPAAELVRGENRVVLKKSGNGTPVYSVYLRQFKHQAKFEPSTGGLQVDRSYALIRNGRRVDLDGPVRSGDEVQVTLTVRSDRRHDYMMIEDPMPSGFEAVRDASQAVPRRGGGWGHWWSNREFRDEKVAIAVTHLAPGERKVTYLMRAEQPGIFRVLPTRIWNMYRPGEGANGAGSSFEVTPAK
ncbi:MAG: alpha-2-macroglobulin family protein [Planctomycetota bacterium]|jgi:uncharacterized protein YfaS (alpha-2-macroglobulin family)